jgi:beta-glucosidase
MSFTNRYSYQIEGAIKADGRGPSIWDAFCDKSVNGSKIAGDQSGVRACDSYNRTAEDIKLLQSCGAKSYRFSIAWSRIIPQGGRKDPVSQAGIDHYVKFVDDLLDAGITPMVTLFHWDLPDNLEKAYGGFLNKDEFVADFEHYARVCFRALPKVRHWITFNEPYCSTIFGYSTGTFAPGRTSDRSRNPVGDSSKEPWIVAHNILIAHGAAVKTYRSEFKRDAGGVIGITLNADWALPYDSSRKADHLACERRLEFWISWFADPIYFGHYPASMIAQLGSRLPTFTPEEIALVKGSNDFYGMNHYTTNYIRARTTPAPLDDYAGNLDVLYRNNNGLWIGPQTQSTWLHPHAPGFRALLNWISDRYHPQGGIYVTENGTSIKSENSLTVLSDPNSQANILNDEFRAIYFTDYVGQMVKAVVEDGVDVRGYMAWSLMDNFEWAEGYETRFGCVFVDYETMERKPKRSAGVVREIFEGLCGRNERLYERVEEEERAERAKCKSREVVNGGTGAINGEMETFNGGLEAFNGGTEKSVNELGEEAEVLYAKP